MPPSTSSKAGSNLFLTALSQAEGEAGLIVAVGAVGFIVGVMIPAISGHRAEPQDCWAAVVAAVTFAGGVIIAAGGDDRTIAFLGGSVIFLGFNLWVPATYARSAENFPTRARTTGFGLVDGIGHSGGGVGRADIAPLVPKMSTFGALSLVSGFLIAAAVIGQFGDETRNKRFEDVSP